MDAPTPQLKLISFGFGHGPAPNATITVDVRTWFRDPHVSPELREMTGRNHQVVTKVMTTEGVAEAVERLFDAVGVFVGLGMGLVTVAVGCVGGRHRSQVITDQLALLALRAGWTVAVDHRDDDRDVLRGLARAGSDSTPALR